MKQPSWPSCNLPITSDCRVVSVCHLSLQHKDALYVNCTGDDVCSDPSMSHLDGRCLFWMGDNLPGLGLPVFVK